MPGSCATLETLFDRSFTRRCVFYGESPDFPEGACEGTLRIGRKRGRAIEM